MLSRIAAPSLVGVLGVFRSSEGAVPRLANSYGGVPADDVAPA